jgi:ATP synthase protein I
MTKGGSLPGAPDSGDPAARGPGEQDPARLPGPGGYRRANRGSPGGPANAGVGYTYLSYMLGGMLLYGFIGWLVGRWTHQAYLLPVGMIVGLALSVVLIIYRVTRSGHRT